MVELWKSWPDHPDVLVSSAGRVKKDGKLVGWVSGNGYRYFHYLGRSVLVHRAVLQAFKGSCPDGHEGRHLDSNPLNCSASNLEWGTHAENMHDKKVRGTHRVNGTSKMTAATIELARSRRSQGASLRSIATEIGVTHGTINHLFQGRTWI